MIQITSNSMALPTMGLRIQCVGFAARFVILRIDCCEAIEEVTCSGVWQRGLSARRP